LVLIKNCPHFRGWRERERSHHRRQVAPHQPRPAREASPCPPHNPSSPRPANPIARWLGLTRHHRAAREISRPNLLLGNSYLP